MAKTEAFAHIEQQVLQITQRIAEGKLCSFQSIGEHLDVMPRHVAYLLSQLSDEKKLNVHCQTNTAL